MWSQLQDKHLGEVGLVIGNGPSLKDVPLDFLQMYPSFGTNRIYLLDGFTPTYYCSVNPLMINQHVDEINEVQSEAKFISAAFAEKIGGSVPITSIGSALFSYSPAVYIYEGHTVTYVCLQLAYWCGFQTVLLVGVDHRYQYLGSPNQRATMIGDDPNHFSPDYFKGKQWHNPDLARSAAAYRLAKEAYEKNGRRIINLTANTALDVFEKGQLSEWS